jgi:hypothetical protein
VRAGLSSGDAVTAGDGAAGELVPQATTTYYITVDAANARTCPNPTCARVATFVYGETLEVIGTVEGEYTLGSSEWREVLYQDQAVYVHSSLTSLSEPSAP